MGRFRGQIDEPEPPEPVKTSPAAEDVKQPEPQPQPPPQAEPQEQPQPRTVEEVINSSPLPDVAKDWLRAHPQFVTDQEQSSRINRMHETAKYLARGEQYTQRYLDKLVEVLGMRPQPQM